MNYLFYLFFLFPALTLAAQDSTSVGPLTSNDSAYLIFYQKACYSSLNQDNQNAFTNLKEAIKRGAKAEDIITDTDFNPLKSDLKGWSQIDSLLKIQYVAKNPGILQPDLGYELWLMGIEDQRYRTLKKNYKLPGKPGSDAETHRKNLESVKEIIKKSGWPKYNEVGKEGGDAVFLVFQHDDAKNMKAILPLFIAAANSGEADKTKAAMMIDRYLAYTEHVQIYGTQAFRKIKPGQDRKDIPLELYPIADEENLFDRRKKLGMVDFFENCQRLGVEYKSIDERTNYAPIKMKKNWIDAGFLLYKQ